MSPADDRGLVKVVDRSTGAGRLLARGGLSAVQPSSANGRTKLWLALGVVSACGQVAAVEVLEGHFPGPGLIGHRGVDDLLDTLRVLRVVADLELVVRVVSGAGVGRIEIVCVLDQPGKPACCVRDLGDAAGAGTGL